MTGMKAHRPRNFHAELSGESFSIAFRKSIWVVTHFQLGLAEFVTPLLVHSYRWAPKTLVWIECISYFFLDQHVCQFHAKWGSPKEIAPQMTTKKDTPRATVDECTSRMSPNFAIHIPAILVTLRPSQAPNKISYIWFEILFWRFGNSQ